MKLSSKDGRWTVELIHLTATSRGQGGEVLRLCRDGFFVAAIRTIAELAGYVDPVDLEETDGLMPAEGAPRLAA